MIQQGKGTAELTTVVGGKLWAMEKQGHIVLQDEKGGISTVTIPNLFQSNGVIHVVDTVVPTSRTTCSMGCHGVPCPGRVSDRAGLSGRRTTSKNKSVPTRFVRQQIRESHEYFPPR